MPFCFFCENPARYRSEFDKFLCESCYQAEVDLKIQTRKLKEWGVTP